MIQQPQLSLYIHIPWCVQKCPYCDFNSHAQKGDIPHDEYVVHLLADLEADLPDVQGRTVNSIFIGGGTPSLLAPSAMQRLLDGVKSRISVHANAEITMEANPNSVEVERFKQYQQAGINRISIGVQSFSADKLVRLGRVHNQQEAINAAKLAASLGLRSFNLDIMHGLPNQTLEEALSDLRQAIELNPPHLSWYQLTIEPNTLFASRPPTLPDDDHLWEIFSQGHKLLINAGYQQYEISAYAKPGFKCEHNLNYWRFGDYLGIGCGAHGKLTLADGTIKRTEKIKHPKGYMANIDSSNLLNLNTLHSNTIGAKENSKSYLSNVTLVEQDDLAFEYFMNRFRLLEPTPKAEFNQLTGLSLESVNPIMHKAIESGLIVEVGDNQEYWQITQKGKLFLNDLLGLFL